MSTVWMTRRKRPAMPYRSPRSVLLPQAEAGPRRPRRRTCCFRRKLEANGPIDLRSARACLRGRRRPGQPQLPQEPGRPPDATAPEALTTSPLYFTQTPEALLIQTPPA